MKDDNILLHGQFDEGDDEKLIELEQEMLRDWESVQHRDAHGHGRGVSGKSDQSFVPDGAVPLQNGRQSVHPLATLSRLSLDLSFFVTFLCGQVSSVPKQPNSGFLMREIVLAVTVTNMDAHAFALEFFNVRIRTA